MVVRGFGCNAPELQTGPAEERTTTMSTTIVARPLAVLALMGTLVGCVVHEGESSATLLWDPAQCGEIGSVVVGIDLEDLGDGSVDLFDVDCAAGGLTVEDLDPGRYVVRFWGEGGFLFEEGIRLRSGHDNQFDVTLVP